MLNRCVAPEWRRYRWIGLFSSVFLHVLVFFIWRHLSQPPAQQARHEAAAPGLMVRLIPVLTPQRATVNPQPRAEVRLPVPGRRPDADSADVTRPDPAPVSAPLVGALPAGIGDAIDYAPPTQAAPGDLMAAARRQAGKIDRDLRKDTPWNSENARPTAQSRLAKGIAAAGRPNSPSMEEKILPNGTRVTRVRSQFGEYCITSDSVGATDGIDRIQRGMVKKVTSCGSLFD